MEGAVHHQVHGVPGIVEVYLVPCVIAAVVVALFNGAGDVLAAAERCKQSGVVVADPLLGVEDAGGVGNICFLADRVILGEGDFLRAWSNSRENAILYGRKIHIFTDVSSSFPEKPEKSVSAIKNSRRTAAVLREKVQSKTV